MQNGFIENLGGSSQDECLTEHVFRSLPAARRTIGLRRGDYIAKGTNRIGETALRVHPRHHPWSR